MTQNYDNLRIISGSEVEPKEVDWLWYPYIPYGKVTIVQGDPGEGKSTFVLNLAAMLTTGGIEYNGQHALRHTFATRCIESNVQAVVLKNWMGHTDIHVTLDIYADVLQPE